jgi:DNA-binding Xre family transcriptional regulator
MRFRLGEILKERGIRPARLHEQAEAKGIPLGRGVIYRLARGEWKQLDGDTLEMLCEVLELPDPGPLFQREPERLRELREIGTGEEQPA